MIRNNDLKTRNKKLQKEEEENVNRKKQII